MNKTKMTLTGALVLLLVAPALAQGNDAAPETPVDPTAVDTPADKIAKKPAKQTSVGKTVKADATASGGVGKGNGKQDTADATATSSFQVKACWQFRDKATGALLKSRWVQMRVMDDDGIEDDELWRGYTDSTGCATSAWIPRAEECCFSGNQDVYVWFVLENERVSVWDPYTTSGGRDVYGFVTGVQTVGGESLMDRGWHTTSNSADHGSARVFQYANNAWDFTTRHGGRTMTSRVWMDTPAGCPFSNNAYSCYNSPSDTAYIRDTDDGKPDLVGHEYGHFIMDKLYGAGYAGEPSSVHYFCAPSSQAIAWSEGFANWLGAATDRQLWVDNIPGATGDLLQDNGYHMETNSAGAQQCGTTTGDSIEGNVARTLWDLTDYGTPDEGTGVSYSLVLGIVDDCNHNTFREYYDLGTCSWAGRGNDRTAFKNAASINGIAYP